MGRLNHYYSLKIHTKMMKQAWLRFAFVMLLGRLFINLDFTPNVVVHAQAQVQNSLDPIPTFAYYYIWFAESSWRRAKRDYPQLGRYSSDDVAIMRQHVQWAKAAGIDGFIVSWKSTPTLDRRLEKLVKVATEESFHLAIIYQALDFHRQPIAIEKIGADLDIFIARYGHHPVFQALGLPLVIWSGTWRFEREAIAQVIKERGARLQILASERSLAGYRRLADLVDGNAYYWSSGDPLRTPQYAEKLQALGEAVHTKGGFWVAPVAVGFDAQLLGGTRLVPRREGGTLRQAWNDALRSAPDMIGLISWNEFSENSHIEPSENFGRFYLDLLQSIHSVRIPAILNFASDEDDSLLTDTEVMLPSQPSNDIFLNEQLDNKLLFSQLSSSDLSPHTIVLLWGDQIHSMQIRQEWRQFLTAWGWMGTLYLDLNRISSILFLFTIITTSLLITIWRRFHPVVRHRL